MKNRARDFAFSANWTRRKIARIKINLRRFIMHHYFREHIFNGGRVSTKKSLFSSAKGGDAVRE